MRSGTASSSWQPFATAMEASPGFVGLLSSTTIAGSSVIASSLGGWTSIGYGPDYVTVRLEEILEYERRILELQSEVLHYRRLLSAQAGKAELEEEHSHPVVPLDAASIRLVDSLLKAAVSPSATFTDFEEGEL